MTTLPQDARTAAPPSGAPHDELLPKLFASSQRWGWEYRSPSRRSLPLSPAPAPLLPRPHRVTAWCTLYEKRAVGSWSALAVLLVAAAIASGGVATGYLLLAAAILAICAVSMAVSVRRALHRWMLEAAAAHSAHAQAMQRWSAADEQIRQSEEERERTEPQWFAIRPETLRHLDVFGGTPGGWQALLVSVGCSLLGAGGEVNVVDLSQDDVARGLLHAAKAHGCSSSEVALPGDASVTGVFGALDPAAVADILAEAAHGADERDDHSQRSMDARLLTAVCGVLDAPLTVERICAALRVLLHQEPAGGTPGTPLGGAEYDRVAALFGEPYLQHAAPRLAALESVLHPLTVLGRDAADGTTALYAPQTQLQVVRITEDTTALSAAATAHFVLQLLLGDMRGARDAAPRDRTLVVADADALRGAHIEKLAQLARRRAVRLILMFRHLRDDSEKLLGASDTAYFMRLGNAAEANRAAEFIGREHRFVIHQYSLAATDGTSTSTSTSQSASLGRSTSTSRHGGSQSTSSNRTTTSGSTTGESVSLADTTARQRVYEFAVEPVALQSLPETVFVFVDPRRPGPRARVGECDPRLLGLEITLDHPAIPVGP